MTMNRDLLEAKARMLTGNADPTASRREGQEWLVDGWIPFGGLTALYGDSGVGKSLLALDIAAAASRGKYGGDPVTTLLVAKDPAGAVIERLLCASADLSKVLAVGVGKVNIRLPSELNMCELGMGIERYSARLLIIDPLAAFVKHELDLYKDESALDVLTPLKQMAMGLDIAVVIVCDQNRQGDIAGSVAFKNAPDSIIRVLGVDAENPLDRRLEQVK